MNTQNLIESLAADLKPVAPLKPRNGVAAMLAATCVAALGVALSYGWRADIMAGAPNPIVVVRGGLLLLLGLASGIALVRAARPSVGQAQNGWAWALFAALILPLTALFLYIYHMLMALDFAEGEMAFGYGWHCLGISAASAVLVAAAQVLWLRRGAPTHLQRAGWLVGISAGSFGTFAYGLHCPSNSIYYIGIFYSLAVALCALAGRVFVPRIIKW
jgi:hypothetical protein